MSRKLLLWLFAGLFVIGMILSVTNESSAEGSLVYWITFGLLFALILFIFYLGLRLIIGNLIKEENNG